MVLGFLKKFQPMIESGLKIHTIRQDESKRWKPGRKIHFATGVRSSNYNCFKEGECKAVQEIRIHIDTEVIEVDGRWLNAAEVIQLAEADGFATDKELFDFMEYNYAYLGPVLNFRLIHWTNKRY